jgi:hypothetical protein
MTVLWEPLPRQAYAMKCDADQIFYGGAAGGGKTDCSLAFNIRGVMEHGRKWKGIIFRKTFPQLAEVIDRGKKLFTPMGARYNETNHVFTFPNGAAVRLASLERDPDIERYQGQQFTLVVFDELGNWKTDYCWTFMSTRVRSPDGVFCQMLGTGNPGGPGHAWIKNMFIDGFRPDVKYRIPAAFDRERGEWDYVSRCFIPSKLEDNVYLTKTPQYKASLEALPKHLRRAYLNGDWDVYAGQVFDEWRREKHVVKPFALSQEGWRRFYAMDWGYSRPYAVVKLAVNGDGKVIQYGEIYGCLRGEVNKGVKEGSGEAAKKAWADAVSEGVTYMIADPETWNKKDSFPAPITAFQEAGFRCIRANHDRKAGLQIFHDYLKQEDENGQPMFQVFNTCYQTIRTLPALLPDPNKPEDVDSGMEDHLYDAVRYGLMSRFVSRPEVEVAARRGSAAVYSPMEDW